MSTYIDADLITDETATAEAVLAGTADRITSALDLEEGEWSPAEGSPETSLSEAIGIVVATGMAIIQDQERNDFAGFGELILNTPRQFAQPASALARWDFDDPGNHFIPDGSTMVLDAADGTPVAFATVGDVTFTGPAIEGVPVTAIEPGAITEGLTGPARDWEPLPHVSAVTLTTVSSGGADDETRDEYLERVVRRARRMKVVPIITDDYADTALDHPAVGSAIAVRLLDLDAPTDPPTSPGHVTVFIRDLDGNALGTTVKDEVRDLMMGEDRPLAVTVHVGDPTITDLTIEVSVRLATGADEPATVQAIQDALAAIYNPARFGIDEDAPGRWRAPRTAAERTINQYDVDRVISPLAAVAKVEDVLINGGASVELTGWAPLPRLTAPPTVTVLTT